MLQGLLVEKIVSQLLLQVASRLRQRWWIQWLIERRCVRLTERSCVELLGVVGGLGVGMVMRELGQLSVLQHAELLVARLAGDSQVALVRQVVELWLGVWLDWCWPGRPSGGG